MPFDSAQSGTDPSKIGSPFFSRATAQRTEASLDGISQRIAAKRQMCGRTDLAAAEITHSGSNLASGQLE